MEDHQTALQYYRIKTECVKEQDNGALQKMKIEELVYASSYTEAETIAYDLAETWNRTRFGEINIEIIKTKITDVLYNEIYAQDNESVEGMVGNFFEESETSGTGLYMVKVIFLSVDEKSGKEKSTAEAFYVPAKSNVDANLRIEDHLKGSGLDFVIRDTKFDKAEAIYWPVDEYKSKVSKFELSK